MTLLDKLIPGRAGRLCAAKSGLGEANAVNQTSHPDTPGDAVDSVVGQIDLPDAGMSTAEYAVGTVAACAFAAVLYKVVTSGVIMGLLSSVVSRALNVPF